MPCLNRRSLNRSHLLAAFLGMALLAPLSAFPQEFPSRVVRVIAPLAAGGPTDGMARLVAEGLAALWTQPVVVENRPGGNMIIGTTALYQSKPDGYAMGLIGMPHIVNPSLNAQLPYRALEDFSPIVMLAHIPMVVAVYPGLGAASLADLVGIGRAKPGSLNYSATSQAGGGHLATEMFKMKAGIEMTIIVGRGFIAPWSRESHRYSAC
ncbi:MAG: hypothetical protein EXR27_16505 [Betaproteobacteria bacterium]|nr:hypothetical protein [Betaproteobacteria bacterium]